MKPVAHVGVESRLPWMVAAVLDALPEERTGGTNPPEILRTLRNFQHPDHDTPEGWTPPST